MTKFLLGRILFTKVKRMEEKEDQKKQQKCNFLLLVPSLCKTDIKQTESELLWSSVNIVREDSLIDFKPPIFLP